MVPSSDVSQNGRRHKKKKRIFFILPFKSYELLLFDSEGIQSWEQMTQNSFLPGFLINLPNDFFISRVYVRGSVLRHPSE